MVGAAAAADARGRHGAPGAGAADSAAAQRAEAEAAADNAAGELAAERNAVAALEVLASIDS